MLCLPIKSSTSASCKSSAGWSNQDKCATGSLKFPTATIVDRCSTPHHGASLNVTSRNCGAQRILEGVNWQEMLSEFFRPVALGTGAALIVILIVGLRLPRRAKIGLRSFRRN